MKIYKTVSLVALAAVSFVLLSFSNGESSYSLHSKVKDFTLENVNGNKVSLSDYKKAKGFIVVFTCNHCPYAKMYESRIMALDKEYASKGFPVIAISSNDEKAYPSDSFENMKKLAKEKGYTFPYLFDATQQVAKDFGAQKTPHAYVLKKEGKDITVEYVGAIDDNPRDASDVRKNYIKNAVDELLAGKAVSKNKTIAIGCGIKWM